MTILEGLTLSLILFEWSHLGTVVKLGQLRGIGTMNYMCALGENLFA